MTDSLHAKEQDTPATREMPLPGEEAATGGAVTEVPGTASPEAEELLRLQRELDEMREGHLRLAAEYDNYRKRAMKEKQEAGWRAQGDLISAFMVAFDDLERFASVDAATTDAQTVIEGVQMVERKFVKSLNGFGFDILDPTGQPFDPALHEALNTVPASSPEEDGTVAQTWQVGYIFNGTVLRPARVIVKQWSGDTPATT